MALLGFNSLVLQLYDNAKTRIVSDRAPDVAIGSVAYEYNVGEQDQDERPTEALHERRLVLLEPVDRR